MTSDIFVVLDRDGTLNVDRGYTYRIDDFAFPNNCVEGLLLLKQAGARFAIATGQSGIARGKYSEDDMHAFNNYLVNRLHEEGIEVEAVVFCPHHPDVSECDCRKPKIGMLRQLEDKFGPIDWSKAWGVGDKPADSEMLSMMGGRSVLLESGSHNNTTGKPPYWSREDEKVQNLLSSDRTFVAHDMVGAAQRILEEVKRKRD